MVPGRPAPLRSHIHAHTGGEPGGYTSAPDSGENEAEYHDEEYTYEELAALGEVAGTISKGLSAAALADLPRMTWARAADLRNGALDTM